MNSITNAEFLQEVFCNKPDDEVIAVCSKPGDPNVSGWYALPADSKRAATFLNSDAVDANTYFCISTVNQNSPLKRRKENLQRVYVIPLDDVELDADVPAPTYKLETSPGNYQFGYVLSEPEPDITYAQAAIDLIADTANADAAAAIPNKFIRLPVGVNGKAKYKTSPRCALREWAPERKWTLDDLLDAFDVPETLMETRQQALSGYSAPVEAGEPTGDDLYDYLLAHNMVLTDGANSRGFVEILCPWGEDHTTGPTAGYSPLGCGGAQNSGVRGFSCLHGHCADRGIKDFLLWYLNQRLAFDEATGAVYDVQKPYIEYVTARHLTMMFAPYGNWEKSVSLLSRWQQNANRLTVKGKRFVPGKDTLVRDLEEGGLWFNTYTPPKIAYTTKEDLLPIFREHIDYLFESEADNALDFLAYSIHRPQIRAGFGLLHISPAHGTGRGWLKQLLVKLTGDRVGTPNLESWLRNGFNEFLNESVLAFWDEIYNYEGQRWATADKLKEMITEPKVEVNIKYGFKGKINVYANMMFFTNRVDALRLNDNDRRFWVVYNDKKYRGDDYYKELYDMLDSAEFISQVYSWLLRRLDTAELNIRGRAPITEWTRMMTQQSQDDFEQAVREAVNRLRVMGHEVAWQSHLINDAAACGAGQIVVSNTRSDSDYRRFQHILSEMGCTRARVTRTDANGNERKEYRWQLTRRTSGTSLQLQADAAFDDALPSPIAPIQL